MLKGIDAIISPELLKIMCEMGHGDELILADGNFPSENYGKRVIRLDGHCVPKLLEEVLKLYPLDQYVDKQVAFMEVVPGDTVVPTIWEEYKAIIRRYEPNAEIEYMERFAFYERAKKAYAIVATGETAQYANIILKKGCVLK